MLPTNIGELQRVCKTAGAGELRDLALASLRIYRVIDGALREKDPVAAKALRAELAPVLAYLLGDLPKES